ncbi:MAG: hypothetical protein AAF585_04590, partial [Verrucomicrobiota bacterium]
GGVQGPALTRIADRLNPEKLLESLINPNAEIAKGYGMGTATLKDGSAVMGRIAKETKQEVTIVSLDGVESTIKRDDITAISPPMSAMPPMALSLPLDDLRDLVAYLAHRTTATAKAEATAKEAEKHGEDEKPKL